MRKNVGSEIERHALNIFGRAKLDVFAFGRESRFSQELEDFVRECGTDGVKALEKLLKASSIDRHLRAEALLWLGGMDHPETRAARRVVLLAGLASDEMVIRGDAISALGIFADKSTIPFLREAARKEATPELRQALALAISTIESKKHGILDADSRPYKVHHVA